MCAYACACVCGAGLVSHMRSHQLGNEAGRGDDVTECAAGGKQCRSRVGFTRHARIQRHANYTL